MANVGGGQTNRSPKAAALLAMLLTVDGAGSLLDADKLDGADWAAPAAIGSTTPAAGSFTTLSATGAVSLTAASSGLTVAKTTGTTLVVSSTQASTTTITGCATFAGGVGVAGQVSAATVLASGLTSGRVPLVSTGGLLTDSAELTYGGATLSVLVSSALVVVGNGAGAPLLLINGAAGNTRTIRFRTAGSDRWIFGASSAAEAGANAGTAFEIAAYDDAGVAIDTPLTIVRALSGTIALTRQTTIVNASRPLDIDRNAAGALTILGLKQSGSAIGYFGSDGTQPVLMGSGGSNISARWDNASNFQFGAGALATTSTDGFGYFPTCAGIPTGVPTAKTGYAPVVIDSTNNKLYFRSGGAWRDAGP